MRYCSFFVWMLMCKNIRCENAKQMIRTVWLAGYSRFAVCNFAVTRVKLILIRFRWTCQHTTRTPFTAPDSSESREKKKKVESNITDHNRAHNTTIRATICDAKRCDAKFTFMLVNTQFIIIFNWLRAIFMPMCWFSLLFSFHLDNLAHSSKYFATIQIG